MALFTRAEIEAAFARLGELATARGFRIELFAVGGAVMVLRYGARPSTQDVDVRIVAPEREQAVRDLVPVVATELGLPADWLNDGAKGYIDRVDGGTTLYENQGIVVFAAPAPQMLAMKLAAWRDDVDIGDAALLLKELAGTKDAVWALVEPYLINAREMKSHLAFEMLWEDVHGPD